ncbi:heme-binding protein [Cupriavidus pinatubonensis]|uniref:heme-binding protein n=1 Tax=Cupriavidus pinatubonensis TaxID=248026 RepID=UPI001C7317BA|nr:heme-binding protein [Cupriavidus pinatubonensis]QYY28554.1 heme-binding protein [Cupriavidus pinatubonensis]
MSSRFADAESARRAVALALPMLTASLADRDVGESRCMHIVVMDPCRPCGASTFEEAILYEHSLPSRDRWDADYAYYAREKARVAWRTGIDSGIVATQSPHRFVAGDILLPGGIVLDGIVVAVSGANGWYDEAFAHCVAALLRAAAIGRMEASRKT